MESSTSSSSLVGEWSGYIGNRVGRFIFEKEEDGTYTGIFKVKMTTSYKYKTGDIDLISNEITFKLIQIKFKDNYLAFKTLDVKPDVSVLSGIIDNNKCFGPYVIYTIDGFRGRGASWGMYR